MPWDFASMEAVTNEFYESVCWAFYSFVFGVFLREFAPSTFGRWLGRVGVLCAMLVMVLFGDYSIRQCSLLALNSKVRNGEGIVYEEETAENDPKIFIPSGEFRTPSGLVVTYTVAEKSDAGGNDTTVPRASGSSQWSIRRSGQGQGSIRRGNPERDRAAGVVRAVPYAQPSLSEWK